MDERAHTVASLLREGRELEARGRLQDAVDCFQRAIVVDRTCAAAYSQLADLLLTHRQAEQAIALYEVSLTYEPDAVSAWNNRGVALRSVGQLQAAADSLRRAAALKPDYASAWANLGNLLLSEGATADAAAAMRRAIAIDGRHATWHVCLIDALLGAGDHSDARAAGEAAAARFADDAQVLARLGEALRLAGDAQQAVAVLRLAIDSNPADAASHHALGKALHATGDADSAAKAFARAVEIDPKAVDARLDLAGLLAARGLVSAAERHAREAVASDDRCSRGHLQLAEALTMQGRHAESETVYAHAIALAPDDPHANSAHLLAMHNWCDSPATLRDEHVAAAARAYSVQSASTAARNSVHITPGDTNAVHFGRAAADKATSHGSLNGDHDRLRVGYVSPDFRRHSVACFIEGLFELHDRARVEVFAYSNVAKPDSITHRLRSLADRWRDIHALDDEAAAGLIASDGIDVLVDLAGHTANNRLGVFARRPAPLACTWLSYPNITGLETIDYHFAPPPPSDSGSDAGLGACEVQADVFAASRGEALVHLPGCFLCYTPPYEAPEPAAAPPGIGTGRVTFGSFNTLAKLSDRTVELWSRVLKAAPDSGLLLKANALNDPAVHALTATRFAAHGIDPGRLDLRGPQASLADHLATYAAVDIALDPYPYHGTTTTCEAMWMGVPVVSRCGPTHASQVGPSLLACVGLSDLAAPSDDSFAAAAAHLAHDTHRLAELRSTLRDTMQHSALCDAAGFAQRFEDALFALASRPEAVIGRRPAAAG